MLTSVHILSTQRRYFLGYPRGPLRTRTNTQLLPIPSDEVAGGWDTQEAGDKSGAASLSWIKKNKTTEYLLPLLGLTERKSCYLDRFEIRINTTYIMEKERKK